MTDEDRAEAVDKLSKADARDQLAAMRERLDSVVRRQALQATVDARSRKGKGATR